MEQTMNFRDMTPEQRKEIASKGGRTAQAAGTAHRWDSDEAYEAGMKSLEVKKAKQTESK